MSPSLLAPDEAATSSSVSVDGSSETGPERARGRWHNEIVAAVRLSAVAVPVASTAALMPGGTPAVQGISTVIWFLCLHRIYGSRARFSLGLSAPVASAAGTLIGAVAVSAITVWLRSDEMDVPRLLTVAGAVFAASVVTETLLIGNLSRRRVVVIGAADGGAELAAALGLRGDLPFECVGLLDDDVDHVDGAAVLGRLADLPEVMRRLRPDLLVLGRPQACGSCDVLLDAGLLHVSVVGLSAFYEHAFGKVPVRHVSAMWFMSVLHLYQRPRSQAIKRIFDVCVAAIGSIVAAPIMLVVAGLVRCSGPGPVFFRQVRLGEGCVPFRIVKFRTMIDHAEAIGSPVWAAESVRATRRRRTPQPTSSPTTCTTSSTTASSSTWRSSAGPS